MKIFNLSFVFLLTLATACISNAQVSPCDWGKCDNECYSTHNRGYLKWGSGDTGLRNCKKACHAADDKCEADFKSSVITNQLKRQRDQSEAQAKSDAQQREAQARSDAQQKEAQADRSAGNRTPDIALICKPVAVKNYQNSVNSSSNSSSNSNSNSNNSYDNSRASYGSNSGSNSGNSSGSNSTYTCGGQGWENIRVNFSIWVNEKRCNGVPCSITPNEISFNGNSINRITGMASDLCHTYSCERVSSIAPKF